MSLSRCTGLTIAREICLSRIIDGALKKQFDQNFAQYILNCIFKEYGYTNKQEVTTTYQGLTPPSSDALQVSNEKRALFLQKIG